MTDTDSSDVSDLIGRTVHDPDGDKVGTVHDVYLDNESGQPEWMAVSTGLFGTKVSFVPLEGASIVGDDVMVAHSKSTVKDAPNAEADGELSPEEESALYAHYGRAGTMMGTVETASGGDDTAGYDAAGRETDDAMTRSEEELDVSTSTREVGKARLRKWVETENVQMTVPIRREKARMVTETITDANRGDAMDGPEITEGEHVVTLSEEVVDISKHVEPKERVRLETDVETDEVVVDEEIRKERIEHDDDSRDR